jgi:hypothetical protein
VSAGATISIFFNFGLLSPQESVRNTLWDVLREGALRLLRSAISEYNYCAYTAMQTDSLLAKLRQTQEFGELLSAAKTCPDISWPGAMKVCSDPPARFEVFLKRTKSARLRFPHKRNRTNLRGLRSIRARDERTNRRLRKRALFVRVFARQSAQLMLSQLTGALLSTLA